MAEYYTLVSAPTVIRRGATFVKLTDQKNLERDDTRTGTRDQSSAKRRTTTADDNRIIQQQTDSSSVTDTCYGEDDDERSRVLTGLALARIQHRARKSSAVVNENASTSLRLQERRQERMQERRGSNPDHGTRLTCDDLTSPHIMTTSEMTSHREAPSRTIERPTSSWASKSGRRPKYTESGWEVEDEDFVVESRIEKMEINESNGYTVRRSSVNEATCHSSSSQGKNALSHPIGNQEKLMRRASDSSRARSYKEVANELRRDALQNAATATGSHKKKEENHSNGGNSCMSMTNGELARMRAVSRLSHATPQLTNEATSSMSSCTSRHLPRKLDPLPVSQVIGTDMALEEEEEEEADREEGDEEEEGPIGRQHVKQKCSSWVNSDEQVLRRRGSREQDSPSSTKYLSDPSKKEKNIIPKPKLKPIARK